MKYEIQVRNCTDTLNSTISIRAFMVLSDEDTEMCRGMLASHNHDGVVARSDEHLMNIAANSLLYSSETMTTIFYAIHLYLTIPYFI